MTGGDFLVLAPWVLFGAGLTAVSLRLRRLRRPARRHPAAPGGVPGARGRPPRPRPGRDPAARARPAPVTRRGPGRG